MFLTVLGSLSEDMWEVQWLYSIGMQYHIEKAQSAGIAAVGGARGVPRLSKAEPDLEPREKSIGPRRIAGTQDHCATPATQLNVIGSIWSKYHRSQDPPASYRRRAQHRARAEQTLLFNTRPSYFLPRKLT